MDFQKVLTDPRLFMETFFHIKDEKGRIVPFWFNSNQEELYNLLIKRHWKPFKTSDGKTKMRFQDIRHVSLKCRKYGESTFWSCLFFYDTITNSGTNTRIYCQDFEFSKQMLEKHKIVFDNMPNGFQPRIGYNTISYLSFDLLNSTAKAEKPGASESVSEKQGRSTDIFNLHCSEFAQWVNPEMTMQGLTEALVQGGNIVVESTAKKIGDAFHILYQDGKKELKGDGIAWLSWFVPWYKVKKYKNRLTPEQRQAVLDTLTDDEKDLVGLYKLTPEQIDWRRMKIRGKLGNVRSFLREFPEDDVACFESRSQLVFPEPVRRITCKQRDAIPGNIHAIGVDVGGGGEYSDDSSITVIDWKEHEQVYHKNIIVKPRELIPVVYDIWQRYPGIVGIESNNEVGLSALTAAREIEDWSDFLVHNNSARGGWWTGKANKRPLLDQLIEDLIAFASGYPGLKISAQQIVTEMGFFQENDDGSMGSPDRTAENREDATKRLTDDSIMSLVIAYGCAYGPSNFISMAMTDFNERFGVNKVLDKING